MSDNGNTMLRIGVFYDGQYFLKVSNYYVFQHERRSRIDIHGLHQFIKQEVAKSMEVDQRFCRIIDAHYFRGRLSARDADSENKLYNDRVFDDILMGENVTTHYMPLRRSIDGRRQEKGVDVWLALEAYEQAFYHKFDILVLIACDGDYVPLVRKLSALGLRVMLLCWDFKYKDDAGNDIETRTSQPLLDEVMFPVMMSSIIDDRVRRNEPIVNQMFIRKGYDRPGEPVNSGATDDEEHESQILSLNKGYGFIKREPDNVFFHFSTLENIEPYELRVGMYVKYALQTYEDGKQQAARVWVMQD